jgi:hypothetical protein
VRIAAEHIRCREKRRVKEISRKETLQQSDMNAMYFCGRESKENCAPLDERGNGAVQFVETYKSRYKHVCRWVEDQRLA